MAYDICKCGRRKASHAQMCQMCRTIIVDQFTPVIMTEAQIAWVAGIIEGEGCFSVSNKSPKSWWISVRVTDLDIIKRLQAYTGIGSTNQDKSTYYIGKKPVYSWIVTKKVQRVWLANLIMPWLGERRSKRLKQLADIV